MFDNNAQPDGSLTHPRTNSPQTTTGAVLLKITNHIHAEKYVSNLNIA